MSTKSTGVTFKTSHTLTDMDTSGPLTTLDIHDTANNTKSQLTARYVIGCDGGSSFVRKHLAIPFEDLIFDEAWLVVDVLVGDGVDLPDMNIQYCDPARPHTFVVGPKNLRRWEFRIMHGEQPEDMTKDATVWKLLEPWLTPDQATIWRRDDLPVSCAGGAGMARGKYLPCGGCLSHDATVFGPRDGAGY